MIQGLQASIQQWVGLWGSRSRQVDKVLRVLRRRGSSLMPDACQMFLRHTAESAEAVMHPRAFPVYCHTLYVSVTRADYVIQL